MKKFLILLIALFLYSQDFTPSKVCKGCHPVIYKEYKNSMHFKSTIFRDEIHKKVFIKHPLYKKNSYKCAKCHSPTDKTLLKNIALHKKALPDIKSIGQKEAISCAYCHRIKNIEKHAKMNKNIINEKGKYFYAYDENIKGVKKYKIKSGIFNTIEGSPFHIIDGKNEIYKNGKVCMGCHSHKQNSHGLEVCKTDYDNKSKKNCIDCHMPKILGSFVNHKDTKTHRYHGFAGIFNNPEYLKKYIEVKVVNRSPLIIRVKNKTSHNLLLHPLRVLALKVYIYEKEKLVKILEERFFKQFGKDGKKAAIWEANEVLKDNTIKANKTKDINFLIDSKNRKIKIELGFYVVNPKIAKKLRLNRFSKFKILKIIEL
ncbi:multiheme c-type cytochrome [Nitrosophilus kaiyonis]|uniref:multiheme c-type cytochrome n=1 Tax=Nitrosophilus kaiyonis TaxID=2930200 RepID=UPI00249102A9|nr:multiheme c-type cytochrome [Nitrosophilus kaiyonis]